MRQPQAYINIRTTNFELYIDIYKSEKMIIKNLSLEEDIIQFFFYLPAILKALRITGKTLKTLLANTGVRLSKEKNILYIEAYGRTQAIYRILLDMFITRMFSVKNKSNFPVYRFLYDYCKSHKESVKFPFLTAFETINKRKDKLEYSFIYRFINEEKIYKIMDEKDIICSEIAYFLDNYQSWLR